MNTLNGNGDFVEIPLTRGLVAKVSPEDADLAEMYSWHIQGKIAARSQRFNEFDGYYSKRRQIPMHRAVMERILGHPIPDGYECDHINKDSLDNRRPNLRLATRSQNNQNRRGWGKYGRGVRRDKRNGGYKYVAMLQLGSYDTPEEAEQAWLKAARLLRGEFSID